MFFAAGRLPLGVGAAYYIFTVYLKEKCHICIRMGITIFKIFIWGGISMDILSKIKFYGSADASL